MALPTQPLPTIGQPNSTEGPKERAVLAELQQILTQTGGGLSGDNLSLALAQILGISDSLTTRRGKTLNAGAESPTAVAKGTGTAMVYSDLASLPTPDKVSGVGVVAGGLLVVDYVARGTFVGATAGASDEALAAALFVGGLIIQDAGVSGSSNLGVQILAGSAATRSFSVGTKDLSQIFSSGQALSSVGALSALPVTTVGIPREASGILDSNAKVQGVAGGPLVIYNLAAGTYDVEVKWARNSSCASSGAVSSRELRVWTMAF